MRLKFFMYQALNHFFFKFIFNQTNLIRSANIYVTTFNYQNSNDENSQQIIIINKQEKNLRSD